MKSEEDVKEKIRSALTKKAVGYDAKEVVEEYQDTDNGLVLTKKKVTKKHYPPDTQAAKMILDALSEEKNYSSMTDEELEREKERLIEGLKNN